MAHQCTDSDEFDYKSIYKVQATRRYTHTLMAKVIRGISPKQRAV
jgi:hypothetical protein